MGMSQQIAQMLIQRNPKIMNNPRAKEYLDVIMTGDSQKGIQIANGLCKTYGATQEEAIKKSRKFFGI